MRLNPDDHIVGTDDLGAPVYAPQVWVVATTPSGGRVGQQCVGQEAIDAFQALLGPHLPPGSTWDVTESEFFPS